MNIKRNKCIEHDCEDYVWSNKRCKRHDMVANPSKYSLKKDNGLNKPIQKRIKPISDKMANQLKEYRIVRDEYFKEHPICEYKDCNSRDITLHHKAGRIGNNLTNKQFFMSLCVKHHREVEDGGEWVYEQGYKIRRNERSPN